MQRPSLGGRAQATVWTGDEIDTAPDTGQTWGLGAASFVVSVAQVVDPDQGPAWPDSAIPDPSEPWPAWPDITRVDATVIHQGDDQ